MPIFHYQSEVTRACAAVHSTQEGFPMKRVICVFLALAGYLFATRAAEAQAPPQQQATDSQRFVLSVPGNVQIIAPADILIVHDTMNQDQVFPVQQWEVRGNVVEGVTTTFEVMQPFVHSVDPLETRDAQLDIVIASTLGPANWTLDIPSAATNIGGSVPDAMVQISSDFVGWAWVDLTVTFVDNNFAALMAGTYETTVVGTVTENLP